MPVEVQNAGGLEQLQGYAVPNEAQEDLAGLLEDEEELLGGTQEVEEQDPVPDHGENGVNVEPPKGEEHSGDDLPRSSNPEQPDAHEQPASTKRTAEDAELDKDSREHKRQNAGR